MYLKLLDCEFQKYEVMSMPVVGDQPKQHTYITYIHTYLIDHSPLGLFRNNETNNRNKLNRLRIPTGRRQTSWLCTSAAEELNQGLPGINPASSQSGTRTRDLQISSPTPSPLGHAASLTLPLPPTLPTSQL